MTTTRAQLVADHATNENAGRPPRERRLVIGAAVLAAVACAMALTLVLTRPDSTPADGGDGAGGAAGVAQARDGALAGARDAVTALTTLDAGNPTGSIERWQAVTTGTLLESVSDGQGQFQQLIASGDVDTDATVQDAAVTELAPGLDRADVMVALDLTLTPAQGQAEVEKLRLLVTVNKTADGWKASELQNVGA